MPPSPRCSTLTWPVRTSHSAPSDLPVTTESDHSIGEPWQPPTSPHWRTGGQRPTALVGRVVGYLIDHRRVDTRQDAVCVAAKPTQVLRRQDVDHERPDVREV